MDWRCSKQVPFLFHFQTNFFFSKKQHFFFCPKTSKKRYFWFLRLKKVEKKVLSGLKNPLIFSEFCKIIVNKFYQTQFSTNSSIFGVADANPTNAKQQQPPSSPNSTHKPPRPPTGQSTSATSAQRPQTNQSRPSTQGGGQRKSNQTIPDGEKPEIRLPTTSLSPRRPPTSNKPKPDDLGPFQQSVDASQEQIIDSSASPSTKRKDNKEDTSDEDDSPSMSQRTPRVENENETGQDIKANLSFNSPNIETGDGNNASETPGKLQEWKQDSRNHSPTQKKQNNTNINKSQNQMPPPHPNSLQKKTSSSNLLRQPPALEALISECEFEYVPNLFVQKLWPFGVDNFSEIQNSNDNAPTPIMNNNNDSSPRNETGSKRKSYLSSLLESYSPQKVKTMKTSSPEIVLENPKATSSPRNLNSNSKSPKIKRNSPQSKNQEKTENTPNKVSDNNLDDFDATVDNIEAAILLQMIDTKTIKFFIAIGQANEKRKGSAKSRPVTAAEIFDENGTKRTVSGLESPNHVARVVNDMEKTEEGNSLLISFLLFLLNFSFSHKQK